MFHIACIPPSRRFRFYISAAVSLCGFALITSTGFSTELQPPYSNAITSHTEDTYQWNIGIQGLTTFPGTEYSSQPSAGRLLSSTVIGTIGIGMYGLEIHDTIDIPFYIGTSSSDHRIDFSYKIAGLLHTLKLSNVGSAKGVFDIWVDASIVDSSGNTVPGQIGTWDQLYRTDVSWAAYGGEAVSIALSGAFDAFGPGWVSDVLEIIDALDNVIPEHVFNTTYSRFIRAPLNGGQWYKLRIQLGSKTGSAALGLAGCVAATKLDLSVLSVTTPGSVSMPTDLWYPTSSASGSYSVSWPSSAGATSYRVERSSNGGSTWEYAYSGVETSFAESRSNGSYRYRVRASSSAGDSVWRTGSHDCVVQIASSGTDVTARFDVVADSYIYSAEPGSGHGAETLLGAVNFGGIIKRSLLKFASIDLPTTTTIKSAIVKVYASNGRPTSPRIAVALIGQSWTEAGVTWNSAPILVSPPNATAETYSMGSTYQWISLDVISFVRAWVDGSRANHGLLIGDGATDMIVNFFSKDYATSSLRPYLEVVFSEAINAPAALSGSSAGQTGDSLSFSASGASSDLGHSLQYRFDWGDGSALSSWGSASRSKTYDVAGQFPIRVKARCSTHTSAESTWSAVLKTVSITKAHTLSTPNTPAGPSTGYVGIGDEFSTSGSRCSHDHGVEYQFDWGESSQSGWGGLSAFKSYGAPNTYAVKARARCAVNTAIVSEWSGTKSVTISPIPSHTLSVTSSGAAGVVIESDTGHGGTTPYNRPITQSTAVSLTAPQYVGSDVARKRFTEWTGAMPSQNREIAFDMDAAKACTANYIDDPVLTYTVSYNGNEHTSGTAPAPQTKTHGVTLTLAANSGNLAKTGYTFAGWNTAEDGSGTDYAAGGSYTANATVTLYAKWTQSANYTISVSANPLAGGTVSGNGTYPSGESCAVSASANTGYTFANWTEGGTVVSSSASFTFTVTGDRTLVANFTQTRSIQFVQAQYAVAEEVGNAVIKVSRTGSGTGTASVDYVTANGTAKDGGIDYNRRKGTLSWASGDTSVKSISVPIINDKLAEQDEWFTVNLSNAKGVPLGTPKTAKIIILANDLPTGTIKFSPVAYSVKEEAPAVNLTVIRTGGSLGPASVKYETRNGTALADADFVSTSGVIEWANGNAASKTISVGLLDDDIPEVAKKFTVVISGQTGATLGAESVATVTIEESEMPTRSLRFEQQRVDVNEGAGRVIVRVIRTGSGTGKATVNYTTVPGTAKDAGVDFNKRKGTLTWLAGDTSPKAITIPIINDTRSEPDEQFTVTLSGASGVPLAWPKTCTVVIVDNDRKNETNEKSSDLPAMVWASSYAGKGHEAAKVLDGNLTTRWTGGTDGAPWILTLDLGRVVPINQLDILFADPMWTNWSIVGSQDMKSWFDMQTRTNPPVDVRYLFLNFSDDPSITEPPSIQEIMWQE